MTTFGYKFLTSPREHQVRDLEQSWLKPAWARFHEMRTGKGVLTCYEMDAMAQARAATRFLIVCPKRVISTWEEMIGRHCHTAFIIDNAPMASGDQPAVIVVNYDRTWEVVNGRTVVRRNLLAWKPEYVVADESHIIKHRASRRSRAMHLLGGISAKYRRILTGTPDPNSWADYWSQAKFLDPSIFGTWGEFAGRYLVLDWYKRVVGYQHTAELAEKVHSLGSRIRRADCWDVPEVEDQYIGVQLPARSREVYRALAQRMYAEIAENRQVSAAIILTKLLRLAQVTGGGVTDDMGESAWLHDAKIDVLMDTLEGVLVDEGSKAVVFARFRPEVDRISQALRTAHISHQTLHGDTPDTEAVLSAFRGPGCRVLVSQIATGSLGVDLSAAETAVFYSWDFNAATYQQARDRIWAPEHKITLVHLVAQQSVDETMLKIVQGKIERSALLLDRWHEIVGRAAA